MLPTPNCTDACSVTCPKTDKLFNQFNNICRPEEYFILNKREFRLAATFNHPYDQFSWYVLAYKIGSSKGSRYEDQTAEYVCWYYNGTPGCAGCSGGYYRRTLKDATSAFNERVSTLF